MKSSVLAIALYALAAPVIAQEPPCAAITPPDVIEARTGGVEPEDLIGLRDIGSNGEFSPDTRVFTLSPDKQKIAFQLRRANPATNAYCLAMFVMDIARGAKPLLIDSGGDLIRVTYTFRGKAGFPTGLALPIAPRWSPDGSSIAFLKRTGQATQIWVADAMGGGSRQVTASAVDIEDFIFAPEGRSIIFTARPGLRETQAAIEVEGKIGFHYDDRYSPMSSSVPFAGGPIDAEIYSIDLASKTVRTASTSEKALLDRLPGAPDGALAYARSRSGKKAWLHSGDGSEFPSRETLIAEASSGNPVVCSDQACDERVSNLWWTSGGKRLRFTKREGWEFSSTAIYEWEPGRSKPKRIYATDDILVDCEPRSDDLICIREGPTTPRRIECIDLGTGRSDLLLDPNPEFARLSLGSVERIRWKNKLGLEFFGDLVLPTSYEPGAKYPLIIVQYDSRGFLRGGTGDEYPIQALANHGFAVLSFNRPRDIGLFSHPRTIADVQRVNLRDFADRRSVQSSLEIAISDLAARGIIDPKRVGITGLSDGASSVQFGLINSRLFAAAALSSAGWDPAFSAFVGPRAARGFLDQGYPGLLGYNSDFWRVISFARNAAAIKTPILMQLSDDEYSGALEGYTALREAGAPVDLFVFPNEHHIKWQPAHRLAIYRRSLAWFDYWLNADLSHTSEHGLEKRHWDALRAESDRPPPTSVQRSRH
ncbi:MAG: Atxe2 family lasso peptide isopeptidase [Gammaproteobacteria bacterium]